MVMLRVAKHCFFRQRQQVLRSDAGRYAASELRMTIAAVFLKTKRAPARGESASPARGGGGRTAAVLLQPLQLFAHLDFPVPGIVAQAVALTGKQKQGAGHAQGIEGVLQ